MTPISNPLVSGVGISEIAIYQAVKIPLVVAGQPPANRPAPVVAGRDALVRVFVQPEPTWQPRDVIVTLELGTPSGPLPGQQVTVPLTGPSNDPDLATTINFDIPGATITPDLALAVSIREVSTTSYGTASPTAAFPLPGQLMALGAQSSGPPLKVAILPFRYDADGSGRLPDLSEEQLALYRNNFQRMYPTPSVELRVLEPIGWDVPVQPGGNGWSEILQNLLFQRSKAVSNGEATPNEYFYGLFNPTGGLLSYCSGGGCVLGLTFLGQDPTDDYLRGSVGAGFTGGKTADTMAHEIGHAHGREHSPCAPMGFIQDVDPAYPHPDATLGSWGWDMVARTLIDPLEGRDLMSYCEPRFASDYTYGELFDRMVFVNGAADMVVLPTSSQTYRMISVAPDGSLSLGEALTLASPPHGEARQVEALDVDGKLIRKITGRFHPFSHLPGGVVMVEEPAATDHALRVGEKTLTLR